MNKNKHDEMVAKNRTESFDKKWFNQALKLIKNHNIKGKKFCDIGAGRGDFLKLINQTNRFKKLSGIDYSETNLRSIKETGSEAIKVDLENEEEKIKKEFDLITSLEVIEHVFNTEGFCGRLNEICSNNGNVIISTPNYGSLMYKLFYVLRGYPFTEGHHIRFFTEKRLDQFMFFYGFEKVQTANFQDYALGIVHRGFGIDSKLLKWTIGGTLFFPMYVMNKLTFNKISSLNTNLVILYKKNNLKPIGIERINENVKKLTSKEKKIWKGKIKKFMKKNKMKDYIALRKDIKRIFNV